MRGSVNINASLNPKVSIIGYFGVSLLLLSLFTFFFASLMWWLALPFFLSFPLGLVTSQGFLIWESGFSRSAVWRLLCLLVMILLTILLSGLIQDFSFDGNTYHQNTIYALAHGWNPISGRNQGALLGSLWSQYYTLGMETLAASVYSITGLIQTGKAANLWLVLAMVFMTAEALSFTPLSRWRWYVAVALLCNPVVITQMFSFYVDFVQYVLLALAICCFHVWAASSRRIWLAYLAAILAFSFAVKINVAFWVFLYSFIYYLLFQKHRVSAGLVVAVFVGAALAGFFMLGYFPYITNFISRGNPIFPLIGQGSVDIITGNTPPEVQDMSRFLAPFYSIAYPFTEQCQFSQYFLASKLDARLGGFGPIFLPVLLLSFAVLCVRSNLLLRSLQYRCVAFAVSLLVGTLLLPAGWWARYVPFVYLLAVVAVIYGFFNWRTRVLPKILTALLILNAAFFIPQMVMKYVQYGAFVSRFMALPEPVRIDGYNVGMVVRLIDADKPFQIVPEENCNYEIAVGPPVKLLSDVPPAIPQSVSVLGLDVAMPKVTELKMESQQ
ncbi:MAG: hypothetical protein IJ626_00465 [Muribaculaceae bacterium]|nr:hypothetical protein [Muribaculaceae bacterium]